MGFFDKIKDYLSFDEEDDDSLYEAEMRELERKERAKSRRQIKEVEEDEDDYVEERTSTRRSPRTASSVSDRRSSDTGKTAGQLAQERRRTGSANRRTSYESSRSTPPRSPEGSYTPRNNRMSTRRSVESSNVVSMKRESSDISIIKVQSFSDAQEVCDNLIDGKPIIVSFDDPRSSEAQRIMDFIAGCIYVINGNLHTISDSIFLFSPNGVDVSGDYLNMVQNNGFGIPTFNKMF